MKSPILKSIKLGIIKRNRSILKIRTGKKNISGSKKKKKNQHG